MQHFDCQGLVVVVGITAILDSDLSVRIVFWLQLSYFLGPETLEIGWPCQDHWCVQSTNFDITSLTYL